MTYRKRYHALIVNLCCVFGDNGGVEFDVWGGNAESTGEGRRSRRRAFVSW